MRDRWYGDHRDLIKWGGLLEIARIYGLRHILQVAYYRECRWERIEVDGRSVEVSEKVIGHFRDINLIKKLNCTIPVDVVTEVFDERSRRKYLQTVLASIGLRGVSPGIVFLDPDTGLQPRNGKFGPTHTLESELKEIWSSLSAGDVLALYQHQTNKAGKPWIEDKMAQFARVVESTASLCKPRNP